MRFQASRGTQDILPADFPRWERVTRAAKDVCALYGYRPILTPGFEDTELFVRTSGAGSDIVRKEMYTFEDLGGRSLTLRPEGTAPICRAYVEHGLDREGLPQKLYTIAPMYRYDKPQKGRFREHRQLSVEAIGSDDPALDAELIQLYDELLRRLGIGGYQIELNSIGDRTCRPPYLERLRAFLADHAGELDAETREKAETSPLRVFDTKNPRVAEVLAFAPTIGESLCAECAQHLADVRRYLDTYGVEYTLVPTLVRGLDYYTRTTFEFRSSALGAQDALVGGGRYDYLIEEIGGSPTPALGFGAGIERLLLAADSAEDGAAPIDVFVAVEPGAPRERALAALRDLRAQGLAADTDYAGRSLRGQLTHASRLGARVTVIVDADGATVRERGREDVRVGLDELVSTLSR
jgi:histidyl-tRNA synthetase